MHTLAPGLKGARFASCGVTPPTENVNSIWPHRASLIWPHPGRVMSGPAVTVCDRRGWLWWVVATGSGWWCGGVHVGGVVASHGLRSSSVVTGSSQQGQRPPRPRLRMKVPQSWQRWLPRARPSQLPHW